MPLIIHGRDGRRLGTIPTIQPIHIHDGIDEIGAELVRRQIRGFGIRCNINLGRDFEDVNFLEPTARRHGIEESLISGQLRHQTLDDLGKSLEDGVVVDGSGEVADGRVLEPFVEKLVADFLHDVADGVFAVVFGDGVGFVDEDGVAD